MFTGLVQTTGKIQSIEKSPVGGKSITVSIPPLFPPDHAFATPLQVGESIAINGVCLTLETFSENHGGRNLKFHLGPETLLRTVLGDSPIGCAINLERSLRLGDKLGGHFVYGHVDGIGHLQSVEKKADSYECRFSLPAELSKYCVIKGSITIDGVSLTLNKVEGNYVSVTLIPHTWEKTCFFELKNKNPVHIEVDMLAKYVEKLCRPQI